MAINLPENVSARRQETRPDYNSADTQLKTEISADFEAVLILVGKPALQDATERLEQQDTQTARQKARDAILKAAAQIDLDNAKKQLDALKDETTKTDKFRTAFVSDERFRAVAETGMFVRDVQLGMDEIIMQADRAMHRQNVAKFILARADQHGVDPYVDSERRSWVNVIRPYMA